MARPKKHFDESTAQIIYNELLRFADEKDAVPTMHAFWRYMTNKPDNRYSPGLGYDIPFGKFRWHWNELLIRQMITTERTTGALKVRDLRIQVTTE